MNRANVCVVDDDLVYQFTAKKILSEMRNVNEVMIFSDGEKASQYLREHLHSAQELPSVIFLDINMPFMDGWTFLKVFRELKAEIPRHISIYMVSSSPAVEDIERARNFPEVAGYIVKPMSATKFREMISEHLHN